MPLFPKLSATLSGSSLHTVNSGPNYNQHNHGPSPTSSVNNIANTGHHPFELSIQLESPPVILYGPPAESSGSLLSGQLEIDIKRDAFISQSNSSSADKIGRPLVKRSTSSNNALQQLQSTLSNLNLSPSNSNTASPIASKNNSSSNLKGMLAMKDHVLLNSIQLSLNQKVHYAKPFLPPSSTLANCSNCKNQTNELARWDIMSSAYNLPVGKHSYPFSHLLPGNLPATTSLGSSSLTSIKYELVAIASYNNHHNHQTLVKVVLPLNISRSILRGPDRNSLRVFPPTDVTASAVLPNVVYPKSSFALELKLDGVASADKRWRMRRVGWRIEEHIKVKSQACSNHKMKLKTCEEHVRKQQQHHKPPAVKRNQQSGPTSNVVVSNTPTNPLDDLSPSQSRTDTPVIDPNNEDHISDDVSSLNTQNLHPSDHANEELRQQLERAAIEQRKKQEKEYALYCEETRTVASGDLRNGWKSDFSGKGKIELVADLSCFNLSSASGPHHTHASSESPVEDPITHPTVSADIDDPVLGITASHVLIVEVVIAEEILQSTSSNSLSTSVSHSDSLKKDSSNTPDNRLAELSPMFANIKPTQTEPASDPKRKQPSASVIGVPTGSARVLRMQFKLIITERSGLGIAWDDEVPPMYDDVSALSPPTYDRVVLNSAEAEAEGTNPPLYPLNMAPAHTHTQLSNGGSGTLTPGVIYGIGNTPMVTPRPSGHFQSLHGALEIDDFTLA